MSNRWKSSFISLLIVSIIVTGSLCFLWAGTLGELKGTRNELESTLNDLQETKTQLSTATEALDTTQTQLESSNKQLNEVNGELSSTKNELDSISKELQVSNNEKTQILSQYSNLRNQILTKIGYTSQERKSYITPNNPDVAAKVHDIVGVPTGESDKSWFDYKRMYDWVVNNIQYSYDTPLPILPPDMSGDIIWKSDYWRTPAETLKDKAGDCEDMALLLASMMLNYSNSTYAIWTLSISSDSPNVAGHMAVAFPVVGENLAILDPAGNYYTGIRSGYFHQEDISSAIKTWLSYWSKKIPNDFISEVMSENTDVEFTNPDEFVTWANSRQYKN